MAYGEQAIKVMKANRALLKKSRTFKELRKDYVKFSGDTKLEFKELTDFERKRIREKIIAQCRKNKKQEIVNFLISIVCAGFIFYFIYWLAT